MEDCQIVTLYWQRNELAIRETDVKYGRYCHKIAYNILSNRQDAEECVSDTYIGAWNAIPPHRPAILQTFLGKLTRRISLNRWRNKTREKRGGNQTVLALDELSECVSDGADAEQVVLGKELAETVRHFLSTLPDQERDVFLSRYFFLASIGEISRSYGFSESKVKSMLLRTRRKLRTYLQKEELL